MPELETPIDEELETPIDDKSEIPTDNDDELLEIPIDRPELEKMSPDKEIEKLKSENQTIQDRLLRTVADAENSKKRLEREKRDFLKFAIEDFVKDLIPVIDSIDRAISSTQEAEDFEALSGGVELIYKQLISILEKRGVSQIKAIGEEFDPNLHEAVMQMESDETPENLIAKEFQTGYTLHERVIRASMVAVSKGQDEKSDNQNNNKLKNIQKENLENE